MRTNLSMLQSGLEHIAHNYNLECGIHTDNGYMCLNGDITVPILCDIQFLCEDCKVESWQIRTGSIGTEIVLDEDNWITRVGTHAYEQPIHEFWRRLSTKEMKALQR